MGQETMNYSDNTSDDFKSIQTHNGVTINAGAWSIPTTWVDLAGFTTLNFCIKNDASFGSGVEMMWSNDNQTTIGDEAITVNRNGQYTHGDAKIRARYCKLSFSNQDTASHVFSAWLYLTKG